MFNILKKCAQNTVPVSPLPCSAVPILVVTYNFLSIVTDNINL